MEFSTDPARLDRDWLWREQAPGSYWAPYRSRAMYDRQLDGAWRVVGAYRGAAMIGFARAVSDGVLMAYLADVYVTPAERGRGVAAGLLRAMIDDGPGRDFQWLLHTGAAHGLYTRFGFAAGDAAILMERPARLPRLD